MNGPACGFSLTGGLFMVFYYRKYRISRHVSHKDLHVVFFKPITCSHVRPVRFPRPSAGRLQEEFMNQNPIVTITMENGGVIKAELYPEKAPNTVNNFLSLVNRGFYNGLTFHRVISGFMIQGGCPYGTGTGGPGYTIKGEFPMNGVANDVKHDRGVLSMARAMHPDSAGSQFFIMHKKAPHLDGGYAPFGKVTEGMDVVDEIAAVRTDYSDRPLQPVVIKTITAETFGVTYPEPQKA